MIHHLILLSEKQESVWNGQVVVSEKDDAADRIRKLPIFVVVW